MSTAAPYPLPLERERETVQSPDRRFPVVDGNAVDTEAG